MIVIDASALVEYLLRGEEIHSLASRLAAEDFQAPFLTDIEVMHALRRRSLQGASEPEQLERMLAILMEWKITLHAHRPYLKRAWSLRHRFGAYDALYVALAEGLGCPLLTADGRLARAAAGLIPVERV